jgi:SAM-dependent MidA family methyltransferase
VDFHQIAESAAREGLKVFGPVRQADFLRALGLEPRAESLKRKATAAQSQDIDEAVERLSGVGRSGMGELFKVLGLSHPAMTQLPGLPLNLALTRA